MKIRINNKETEVKAVNLQELAINMNLPEKGVAIAISNKMIPRQDWPATLLNENDDIVIIKAACGG